MNDEFTGVKTYTGLREPMNATYSMRKPTIKNALFSQRY